MARTVQGELVAALRPGAWDLARNPPEYVVGQGDSLESLATLYLGTRRRAGELRDLQVFAPGARGPNGPYLNHYASDWGKDFRPGVVLLMPQEAVEARDAMAGLGAPSTAPTCRFDYVRAVVVSLALTGLLYGAARLWEAYA